MNIYHLELPHDTCMQCFFCHLSFAVRCRRRFQQCVAWVLASKCDPAAHARPYEEAIRRHTVHRKQYSTEARE